MRKQHWTKNGKIEENFGVEPDEEVRSKIEVIDEARRRRKSSFPLTDGHMSSEKC